MAIPSTAIAVDEPSRLPWVSSSPTWTEASGTRLPYWSSMATVTGGSNAIPATAPRGMDRKPNRAGSPAKASATTVAGRSPSEAAVALAGPDREPSVHTARASPSSSVSEVSGASVPPPSPAAKVTGTPATGCPRASVTRTTTGLGRAWPTLPDCPEPAATSRPAGVPTSGPVPTSA